MNKKTFVPNKLLIILGLICVVLATLIIGLYLDTAEISIFANSANAMKTNYTSTESNTWDISENEDGSVIATLDENGLLTISGHGKMKDWYVNETTPWYSLRKQIKSIEFSGTVTSIGWNAFMDCESLTSIEIPSSVTSIGFDAFDGCKSLTSIEVEENNTVYKDENGVLYSKDGTRIIKYPAGKTEIEYKILDGVTRIGWNAFMDCESLTSIEIPSSVTSIGFNAFDGCKSLTSIEVEENNTVYKDENGVLYSKDGTRIIKYPAGKTEIEYKILDGVTRIGDSAFYSCKSLTSIEIPSSVTRIGDNAFYGCESLTSIVVPTSVINIGIDAFDTDSKLTIICKSGSVAETYAVENYIQYIIDESSPILTIISEATVDTIIVNSEATDEISGIEEDSYRYSIKKENEIYGEAITGETSHTFTNLNSNTKYIIKVEVSDKLGNTVSKEIEVITLKSNRITTSAYNVGEENLIIKGIQPKTKVEQLKGNIQSEMSYQIIDETGNVVSDTENARTGYKIKMEDDKIYTIIVTGDTNGDGQADIKDILAINKHRLNKANLTGEYLLGSDVNGDGKADIKDILQINKFRLGKIQEL